MNTTKTDTPPIDNPRFIFSGGGGINGDLLLPDGLAAIPKEVETAHAAAVAAFDRYQAAEREYRHAREQARLAPSLDASADAAAAALGKPLPAQCATHASREALALAARRFEASKVNARDTQIVLARAIAKHKPDSPHGCGLGPWDPECCVTRCGGSSVPA
jgi:hypothetical protein